MSKWATSTLGAECSIAIGGTPARNRPAYWDVDKQTSNHWVAISDLKERFITSTSERISDEGVRRSNAKLVKRGAVLLSFKLTVGRAAITGVDLYTNEAIAALQSETLDPLFLYYGLQSWDLIADLDQAIKGATLNKEKLKRIPISFPRDRDVQVAIASVLDIIDHAIERTEASLAKEFRIKMGQMQDLLTLGLDAHGRLRDPLTHRFKPSALGSIPEEWEAVYVEELCDDIVDCPHSTPKYEPSGIPCIRTADMVPGKLMLHNAFRVAPSTYQDRISRLVPRRGDIIYSREGERLGIAAPVEDEPVCLGQRVMLLRPKAETNSTFMTWAMNSPSFYNRVVLGQIATTSPHVNVRDIKKALVVRPEPPEQVLIGEALASDDSHRAKLLSCVEKLRRLKSGLMNDLLTGRVPVAPLLPKLAD